MIFDKVTIKSGDYEKKLNVYPYLRDPKGFYGDLLVDHLVKFKDIFIPLIGKYRGVWFKNPEKKGIFILENYYYEAKLLMERINKLAQKIVGSAVLYDDKKVCSEYFQLAEEGYRLLRKYQSDFSLTDLKEIPVSLERAGLVTTRLALGLDKDAKVHNEIRVVTKRTHLKEEPANYLTATVKWRDEVGLKKINHQPVMMADFVNPASGASTAAFILAAKKIGIVPSAIYHRSISATKQGIVFMKKALEELGIKTYFYTVGCANELNSSYYLIGDRAVGDAGHILRHFLPKGYQQ